MSWLLLCVWLSEATPRADYHSVYDCSGATPRADYFSLYDPWRWWPRGYTKPPCWRVENPHQWVKQPSQMCRKPSPTGEKPSSTSLLLFHLIFKVEALERTCLTSWTKTHLQPKSLKCEWDHALFVVTMFCREQASERWTNYSDLWT